MNKISTRLSNKSQSIEKVLSNKRSRDLQFYCSLKKTKTEMGEKKNENTSWLIDKFLIICDYMHRLIKLIISFLFNNQWY